MLTYKRYQALHAIHIRVPGEPGNEARLVSYPLSHTSYSKDGGGRHFLIIISDGLQQTLGRVVQSHPHVTVPLSVSGPQHHHLHNADTVYTTVL